MFTFDLCWDLENIFDSIFRGRLITNVVYESFLTLGSRCNAVSRVLQNSIIVSICLAAFCNWRACISEVDVVAELVSEIHTEQGIYVAQQQSDKIASLNSRRLRKATYGKLTD